jgi:tetratricopeptide (TPR) repeat protein
LPVSVNKAASRDATVQGQAIGTPSYMPPEQAEGRIDRIDERSDVYGLGAVLYDILTGEPPFDGPDTPAVLAQVIADAPLPPRRSVPHTPRALEAVCLKAIAKKPAERYASVKELAGDVERWLGDEPVTVYRDSWATRTGRWTRQHRTGVATGLAAAFVMLVSLGLATILLSAANERERAAKEAAERSGQVAQAERDEAARQRDEANRQRDRAGERFRLARQAVDEFHTQVSQSPELKAHNLERLRTRLLESAAQFYEKFVKDQGGDSEVRAERGRAYSRLGEIYGGTGQKEKAENSFKEALAVHERLVADFPADLKHRHDLAQTYLEQSKSFYRIGNWQGRRNVPALAAAQRALAVLRELVRLDPKSPEYRFDLAQTLNDIGEISGPREPVWKEALAIAIGLNEEYPQVIAYRKLVAVMYNQFGYLNLEYEDPKRYEEAVQFCIKGLAIARQLDRDQTGGADSQLSTSELLGNLTAAYSRMGKKELALETAKEGAATARQAADTHPSVLELQKIATHLLANLANQYERNDKKDLAVPVWAEAIGRSERLKKEVPNDIGYRMDLARYQHNFGVLLQQLGRGDEAKRHFDASEKEEEETVHAAYEDPARQIDDLERLLNNAAKLYQKSNPARAAATTARAKALRAVDGCQRAVDAQEKLVKATPGDDHRRDELGQALHNLGLACEQTDPVRSAAVFGRAVEIRERLAADHPTDTRYRDNLAWSHHQQAVAYGRMKDLDKAEVAFVQAAAVREQMVREHPDDIAFQKRLGQVYFDLGVFRQERGRLPEAEAALRQALEVLRKAAASDPPQSEGRQQLANTHAILAVVFAARGDHDGAAAEAEAATAADSATLPLYNAACGFARASAAASADIRLSTDQRKATADRLANRAVEVLGRIEASGFFREQNYRDLLNTDDDLTSLRDRDDFRKLLKRVGASAASPEKK